MHPELTYSAPFFIAALFILAVALFAFRRRRVRGAWYLTWLSICGAVWAIFEGVLYLGMSLEADILATYIQYLGAMPFVVFGLFFSLSIFGFERWINRKTKTLFIFLTTATIALVWTDPLHHLVYRNFYYIDNGTIPLRGLEHGFLWWMIIAYQYLLAMGICGVLIHTVLTSTHVLRAQAGLILAAVAIVWIVNVVYVFGFSPVPNMDISPLSFILVALPMAWGFFRYHLLDILPIAKAQIYQNLSEPVVVLNDKNRILDLNPAAAFLLNTRRTKAIGRSIDQLLNGQQCRIQVPQENHSEEFCLLRDGREHFFDMRTSALNDRRGAQIGRIVIFQDVTEHKRAARVIRESERLQGVLEMAGAVCHELSQPVMAILGYSELIRLDVSTANPLYAETAKLAREAEKISKITQKLMRITRYETRTYQGSQIIDIDKASTT